MLNVTNSGTATSTCWSCGEMRTAHFCGACGKVQPPRPVDYFAFFGLPRKLNIDVAALERDFYSLSRKLHPDLYARAGTREQEWSQEQSSLLNDAYRTLRDPIRRTEYLLKLEGVQLEEQSKIATEDARTSGEPKKQIVPPALLEEIFELNMQLEEMWLTKQRGDRDPELVKQLEDQKKRLESDFEDLSNELNGYWREWDRLMDQHPEAGEVPEAQRKPTLDKLIDLLNRRNYLRNLVRDVNDALETP